jgi:hypothetical protein
MAERERMDPTTIASAVCEKEFWPSGDARFWPLTDIVRTRRSVRFRGECVAKLFAALRTRNNRIRLDGAVNQYCALAFILESILLVWDAKIVLQHIRGQSGHRLITCVKDSRE